MPTLIEEPATAPRIIERFAGVAPYSAERPIQPIDLWLDMNEACAPDPSALAAIGAINPDALRRYPDASALERAFAERIGIDAARVLATAGADDAIERVCRVSLDDSRTLVTHTPGFSMIERSARCSGAKVANIEWAEGEFPVQRFLEAIDDRTGVVALVSPNNPTGLVVDRSVVERAARRCAEVGAALLLDLAYVEFAADDPTAFALTLPNTVIARTLSKAYGLAGLRVGFLAGDAHIIAASRAVGGPFAISSPSIAAAAAVLTADDSVLAERRERIARERDALTGLLRSRGASVADSHANFALARFDRSCRARWVRDALRGLGVAVRAWPDASPLACSLRITCPGNDPQFARLTDALKTTLAPEAILLDLDGVLADVSRSYRAAIIATCESFGVRVTPADVAAIKRRGQANNDWIVTRDLLAQSGLDIELREVIERFEAIYQGTPSRPGLRETESLIGSLETVRRLASRVPLAIVTGRPRADAERFFDRFGLAASVSATVCMEDGPSKPDPTVVRLALERLGVKRAWMVGDTVDDVRAARAAGIVPLGIIAPNDDRDATTDALLRAGAARVLSTLDNLSEILP